MQSQIRRQIRRDRAT